MRKGERHPGYPKCMERSQQEGGERGRGRGCRVPSSHAAGNALTQRDATYPGLQDLAAGSKAKATNEWPDAVIESGSG